MSFTAIFYGPQQFNNPAGVVAPAFIRVAGVTRSRVGVEFSLAGPTLRSLDSQSMVGQNVDFSGGCDIRIYWSGEAAGNVEWKVQFDAVSDGDSTSDGLATVVDIVDTASPVDGLNVATATLTAANIDSAVAGDMLRIRVGRDPGDTQDTIVGSCWIFGIELRDTS